MHTTNNNCVIVDSEEEKNTKIRRIKNRIKKIDELIPTFKDNDERIGKLKHEKQELHTILEKLNPIEQGSQTAGFYKKYMKYKAKYMQLKSVIWVAYI